MRFIFSRYRTLALSGLMLSIGLGRGHAQDPVATPDTATVTVEELTQEALKNNRRIKATMYRVEALHSSPDHVWYLDPPEVGVEFYQAPVQTFPNPIKDQMEVDYSLRQSFPFPGKISSRIEVEHKHAQAGEAEMEAQKRRIVREVKTRYYELYLLDRRLEFTREDQALMNRFIEISRKQYEVGMGRQSDILKAQTELTRLKTDSIALAQSRRAMEGMLNSLLSRKTIRPIRVAASLSPARTDWTLQQILPLVKENHPELQAMQKMVEVREAEKTLAKKDFLPDFMVRGVYKDMLESPHPGEPEDFWSVMVGMNIPLAFWSAPKYRAGVVRSRAALNQTREEFADMENMALAKAQEGLLKATANTELSRISRSTLLPQAQQTLESNLAAYQAGRGDFMTLLDAFRIRLMARQNAEMSLMQLLVSQAELEEAVGMDLNEISSRISGGAAK